MRCLQIFDAAYQYIWLLFSRGETTKVKTHRHRMPSRSCLVTLPHQFSPRLPIGNFNFHPTFHKYTSRANLRIGWAKVRIHRASNICQIPGLANSFVSVEAIGVRVHLVRAFAGIKGPGRPERLAFESTIKERLDSGDAAAYNDQSDLCSVDRTYLEGFCKI